MKTVSSVNSPKPASKISKRRKVYIFRLVMRCLISAASVLVIFFFPSQLSILSGWSFFREFSVFHILWLLWMVDMALKLTPKRGYMTLGSQKQFGKFYIEAKNGYDRDELRKYIRAANKRAVLVMIGWLLLNVIPAVLRFLNYIDEKWLLIVTLFYYISDLICVLIWCPFRIAMGNRCCTTCRIYNWDHFFMFTPMILIPSFFSLSLFAAGLAVWIIWEATLIVHPERFWERSNAAIRCVNCTDKVCTQFCPSRKALPSKIEK